MKFKKLLALLLLSSTAFGAHVNQRQAFLTDIINATGTDVFRFPTSLPTASRACVVNSDSEITSSSVLSSELDDLIGVTSNIQTQLNSKQVAGNYLVTTNNLSDVSSPSTSRTNLGLGTAAVQSSSFFLQTANNLSDLSSASTSRTNLGLGTAAVQSSSFFLQTANNLSDLPNATTARSNLGLGTAAVQSNSFFLQTANNLSDLPSASTARTNLGLGSSATHPASDFLQAANNLSDVSSAPTSRTNLGLGTAATHPATDFISSSVMTTLGDFIYGGASGSPTRLPGDTSDTRKFLRELSVGGVATAPVLDVLISSDIPNNAANTSGNAATVTTNANLTGPITSVGNATSVASQTGTGSTFVMNTSPTLVTPTIGAASGTTLSLTGPLTSTQATGTAPFVVASTTRVANLNVATAGTADSVTTNANLTGPITSVGNATSVASQTGTGSTFVMNTSPTLVTPTLGAASGTTLSLTGPLTSTQATGTAPFVIASTTRVSNLNVATAGNADTVTTNANLTGPITSVGNATSVASQTGTGSTFVMNTSPTLVTPTLGVAKATSISAPSGSTSIDFTTAKINDSLGNGSIWWDAGSRFLISGGNVSVDWANKLLKNNAASTILDWSGSTVVANITGNLTGTASNVTTNANLTGPITSVGNATSVASQTGTGSTFVMNTSPTLVTPVIGAASGTTLSLTGPFTSTQATGTAPFTVASTTRVANLNVATAGNADTVTTNANLTGPITSVGNATSVASQTGTGSTFVMNTSPTLVTPNIGAATGTSLVASGNVQAAQVGVGVAPTANSPIEIQNDTSAAIKAIQVSSYGTNSFVFRNRKANGTSSLPTAVTVDQAMGAFGAVGYGTTAFPTSSTGSLSIHAGGTFTDTSWPTYIRLNYTPNASTTSAEGLRLNFTGNLLLGTTTDDATNKLQVSGGAKATAYTVSGTGGAGFYEFTTQSAAPSTPSSNNFRLFSNAGMFAWKGSNGFVRNFDGTANTADRTYTLPDADGTVLLSTTNFDNVQITGNTSAVSGKTYLANTTSSAFNLTLPTPTNKAWVRVKDWKYTFGTNNLTVVRNGSEKIEGLASDKILLVTGQDVTFVADGTDWVMF